MFVGYFVCGLNVLVYVEYVGWNCFICVGVEVDGFEVYFCFVVVGEFVG